jgi:hypothetical protein
VKKRKRERREGREEGRKEIYKIEQNRNSVTKK